MQWRVSYYMSRLSSCLRRSSLRFSVRLDAIRFVGLLSRLFPFLSKNESVIAASETVRRRLDLQSQYDFFAQMQWCVSYYISRLSRAFSGLYCDSPLAASETERTRLDLQSHYDFLAQMQWRVSYCISRLLPGFVGLYCDSRSGWMPSASWDGCSFLSKNESVIGLSSAF
ncbi:hypothetical protein CDAR_592361 [Caerostris darwini]|uniref:Uncharacterized protein n=1 Tax=Caerostris darwini TaxID=1538125 RepID=A0AAV4TGV1_9ARAC|nr:hypothetical protein CDAR_592361 [Caerostris darwini]